MNYAYYIPVILILLVTPLVIAGAWIKGNNRKKTKGILRKQFENFAIRNNCNYP
ncbi:MAG TPA: hypothetical protein VIJ75_03130 [Hanamia sp.]